MAFGESDTLNNNLPPNCIVAGHNHTIIYFEDNISHSLMLQMSTTASQKLFEELQYTTLLRGLYNIHEVIMLFCQHT